MPLQTLIIPFVVVAFVAIVWRFLPRGADDHVRLPAIVDDSVGMWLLRSALGRGGDGAHPVELDIPEPAEDEIAYRIGVPGAPPPTMPTRVVVSEAEPSVAPGLSAVPAGRPTIAIASAGSGRRTRPSGALAAQRRWAGAVALVAVVVAVATLALGSRQVRGEVLAATGTPAGGAGGFVSGPAEGSPAQSSDASPTPPP